MKTESAQEAAAQLAALRRQLAQDAEWASENKSAAEWLDQHQWAEYVGSQGHVVYASYSDEELLDMLRAAAAELGRNPPQHQFFCVYRNFIRRRFGNWPKALEAAGLRDSKKHGKTRKTQRNGVDKQEEAE